MHDMPSVEDQNYDGMIPNYSWGYFQAVDIREPSSSLKSIEPINQCQTE